MSELQKRLDALSPEKLALLSKRLQGKGRSPQPGQAGITRLAEGSPRPLSLAQQRLWFLSQLQPDSSFYNMAGAMRLAGAVNVSALERTLNEIARRHEVLRTSFPTSQGRPVQSVAPAEPRALPVTDLRGVAAGEREAEAARLINEASERPFDLASGPLYRTELFRLADDEHVLLVVMHHIVGDGWSIGVFLRELAALYEAFARGLASPLEELPLQYADFAAWQEQRLVGGGALDAQLAYWERQLRGSSAALALPFDRERPATSTHRAASETFDVPPETFDALEALCRREGVTLFMATLAAFYVLLHRHTGQEDINVGSPIAGRGHFETEGLIGFFINSLVLRGNLSGDPTFRELLARVREMVVDAQSNQDAPFEKIVEVLQPERSLVQTPLFQAVFRTEEMRQLTGGFELPGLAVTPVTVSNNTTEFDLICSLANHGDRMTGTIIYSADLFEAATVRRLAADFRSLLEGVVADASQTVRELDARADGARREEAEQELRRALVEWNDTRTETLPEALFHEIFEQQVERTPDALAVIFEGERLTYRELNARANQLAHYLRGLGVGSDVRVGLCIERSPLMLVGLLGVMKAGGAYLPLDPSYPLDRLSFMLEDAQVPILLTQERLVESLPVTWAHVVCLDDEWDAVSGESDGNPSAAVGARDLAYVIYTSGSTGRPKGVMVEHGGLRNLAEAQVRAFGEPPTGRVLQLASLSFDASIFEIVMGLRAGATVCLGTRESLLPGEPLLRTLREQEVTNLTIPPSILSTLPVEELPALRTIIVAGEACPAENVARWSPGRRFFNAYGPTETTVWATLALCADATRRPPIGRPIINAEVYLLDESQRPVPVGQPGELYIGGDGLARGYLGRPALTAERFVPDPFSGRAGARLYRTGDLARHLPDGQIEFIGRVDHQVKLRGLRIELGEIESLLTEHTLVHEAVVVLHDGGASGKRLVAYVVPARDEAPAGGELREFLHGRLPDYMIPSAFVALAALPLTPNGKIDHRALPAPDAVKAESAYVAPRNRVEEILAESWMQVLETERVGIDDNFFALGGDSIRSVQVLSRAQELGLGLTLQQLFKHQTIRQLAEQLGPDAVAAEAAPLTSPFSLVTEEDRRRMPEGVEDAYPLTLMQAGMVFQSELHKGDAIYHAVNSFHLRAPFDAEALRAALQQFASLHAVMRTSFDLVNFSEPLQLVHREAEIPLQVDDLRGLAPEGQERAVTDWINEDKLRRLDLSAAPLVRFHVHRRTDETLQFTFTAHHAVFDGWSDAVFLTELFRIYLSLVKGDATAAPEPLAVAFRDYVALELDARRSEESRRFWSEMLSDADTSRGLSLPAPAEEGDGGERFETVFMRFPEEVGVGLNEFARSAGVPLKHVLMAAHLHVMSVLGGRTDVVTGLVSNGRPEVADGERVIGLFLNTLPFRLRLGGGSWEELVRETFGAELQTLPHRRYPLAQIQLDADGHAGGRPLFETCFNYTHFHVYETLEGAGEVEVLGSTGVAETEFAVMSNFNVDIRRSYVDLLMICDASQLPREQIRLVGEYYRATLEAMAADPAARYDAHSPLTTPERERLLVEWNSTAAAFPCAGTLQELFEAQVARTPDAEALVFEGERLTYRELDARANQLAHHLRELGVGPESRVGVCVERSFDMVVAVLGALKAGGAYVPLDPAYPQERLALMLEDARAEVLLTQQRLAASLPTAKLKVVSLDSEWEAISRREAQAPAPLATAENLAYVIYTSGSTGRPKGVAMPHRPLVNLIQWQVERAAGGPPPRALQFASLSFDVSFQEIFTALCSGAALVLISEDARRDGRRLLRTIEDERVERLCLPFVALNYLAEAAEEENVWPRGLRQVMSAGEQLKTTRAVRRLFENLPGCTLDNQCGPSETHAAAAFMLPETITDWPALPPIGRPVANARFYVLDEHLRPVPAGVPGELYLGGACVSRGYLDRPALTAERYVPNPFAAGERMYRSGDVVRYLPSGDIEWLWRKDEQVKIRGFRVELGEVETALAGHDAVRAASVIVREDEPGDKRLVAYLVAEEGASPSDAELRAHLHESLPEYMVPSAFVLLPEMPLTPSGKVNRRALPAPGEAAELAGANRREGARTEIEELMCTLFAQVLRVREVGATDSFFDLGGHSLLAMQLVSRVREALRVEVGLQKLFERPTPRAMAEEVESALRGGEGPACVRIERAGRADALPLSYAQQRLWFLDQLEPGSPAYNIPVALRLRGQLDARALEAAFNEIIRRHESLRTTFGEDAEGDPIQVVGPAWELYLEVEDVDAAEVASFAADEAGAGFDLAEGPLLRARLLRVSEEEHVLLFTMHHIISDGWSMNVLVREVTTLYEAFATGGESPLEELPVQYADFAVWQRAHLAGGALDRQLGYWREQLAGAPAALELPTDRPRPAVLGDAGATRSLAVSAEVAQSLKELGRKEGATLFMTLLAAWQSLLSKYSGQEDIVVGSPIANRNRAETEGLIGFFVNTLVLRTDLSGDPEFRELLRRVRGVTLGAYAHQDLPFERLVEELQPERSLSHTPLFQSLFALQSTMPETLEATGLALESWEPEQERAKFDLTLAAIEAGGALNLTLEFKTELFDAATAERMLGHFARLLEGIAADPGRRLSELELLGDNERRRLLVEFNDTATDYPRPVCLQQLFERQVGLTPEAAALVFEEEELTYRELNARANRLAHRLRRHGVGPDVLVGVMMERSTEMVVALLGILKAGGAYVPLDPAYPADRLAFMMEDARIGVLLTQERLLGSLPEERPATVVALDTEAGALGAESADDPLPVTGELNLAYCIYTSGSTGRPKGAMNTHLGICNRLFWMQEAYGLDADDRVLQKTTFSFDVSVWEFFWPLVTGARLVMARPGGHQDGAYLVRVIREKRITTMHFVPSMLQVFLEEEGVGDCDQLRRVVCSGEALPFDLQERFFEKLGGVELHNLYGPTEAAVDVTFWPCVKDSRTGVVPIGRAIANTQMYVLDRGMNPAPVGVPGELYIGGVQLARGYLSRPALTAERFIPDPFSSEPGARLYRTGDLARFQPDGNIRYLGRLDHQVKVRGFRIELGEIETALAAHPAVQEAAVVVREHAPGDQRIVAYVVPDAERAAVLRGLLRMEAEGRAPDQPRHELPNGMPVYHLNRGETDFLYQELFVERAYLRHGIALRDGACVFDVGANIGMFSLFVAQACRDAEVFAFEPLPPVFRLLEANATLHGVRARLFNCGLSSRASTETFTFYPHLSIISGQFAEEAEEREVVRSFMLRGGAAAAQDEMLVDELLDDRLSSERYECRLRTISEIIAEHNVERIDLLKVDVEKAELDVLAGVEDRDWAKVRQVVVEVHDVGGRLQSVESLLTKHGFRLTIDQDEWLRGTNLYNVYATKEPAGFVVETSDVRGAATTQVWGSREALVADVQRHLRERLPEYMVPVAFVTLAQLPLTPNGKLDRGALPAPAEGESVARAPFVGPRDELELRLTQIWQDVLGVRAVGVRDNFFDLGGHSLLGVRLLARVRQATGAELPTAALFQDPTVELLAARIRRQTIGAAGDSSPLVEIQGGGDRPAFFCVHPSGGNVLCYAGLAQHLGAEQPFYGLQARGLDGAQPALTSVEEMATAYVEAVRAAQPEGPYLLGGWSMGGLVAFEMARQLTAQGQEVTQVALIDTTVPTPEGRLAEPDELSMMSSFALDLGLSWEHLRISPDELLGMTPDEQLGYVLGLATSAGVLPPDVEPAQVGRLYQVFKTNVLAMMNYEPRPWHGRVTLFRAERQEGVGYVGGDWKDFALEGVEQFEVPGDHFTMVRPPHVETLAESLARCLEEATTCV
ncbi:MAG TPA: amino acid adenylation domain-containing protein [Pyrinomonadaceae bacterium]